MDIPVIGAGSVGRRHHENLCRLGVRSDLLSWRGFDAAAFRARRADAVVIATATPAVSSTVDDTGAWSQLGRAPPVAATATARPAPAGCSQTRVGWSVRRRS